MTTANEIDGGQTKPLVLSAQLTKQARGPTKEAQRRVWQALSFENFTLEALEAILHHLRPELMVLPPHFAREDAEKLWKLRYWSAHIAITESLVECIRHGCREDAPLEKAAAARVVACLPGILKWVKVLLREIPSAELVADFLRMMVVLNERLKRAALSSRAFVAAALGAFVHRPLRGGGKPPYMGFLGGLLGPLCPILSVVEQCAFYNGSRAKLVEELVGREGRNVDGADGQGADGSRAGRLDLFVESIVERLEYIERDLDMTKVNLSETPIAPETPELLVIVYMQLLSRTLRALCAHHPLVLKAFLVSKYPGTLFRAVTRVLFPTADTSPRSLLARAKKPSLYQATVRESLTIVLCSLALLEGEGSTEGKIYVHALNAMIEGGLVRLMVELTRSFCKAPLAAHQSAQQNAGAFFDCLGSLQALTVHPLVAPVVLEALDGLDPKARYWGEEGSDVACTWKAIRDAADLGKQICQGELKLIKPCDNLQCPGERREFRIPKACSGCRSVAYCSEKCQKVDWKEFHKKECQQARKDYLDMAPVEAHYRTRLRWYHITIVASRFNRMFTEQPGDISNHLLAIARPKIMLFNSRDGHELYSADDYLYKRRYQPERQKELPGWRPRPYPTGIHYFDRRVDRLLKEYHQEVTAKNVFKTQLLDIAHQYGGRDVLTMIKFKWNILDGTEGAKGKAALTVVSAVSRIGPLMSPLEITDAKERAKL